jgi:uncharacterized RDD family membrane protein YckC
MPEVFEPWRPQDRLFGNPSRFCPPTTVGKKLVGVVVTDTAGGRISLARATGRYLSKLLTALTLLVGLLALLLSRNRQALHDRIAGTRGLDGIASEPVSRVPPENRGM